MNKDYRRLFYRSTIWLGFALVLFTQSLGRAEQSQSSASSAPPEEMARSFYQWYLRALYHNENADPLKEHRTNFEKYVTARLLQKLITSRQTTRARKGPDVDTEYFLGTLDLNSEWERNINVSDSARRGETVVVRVSFSAVNPESKRLEVEQERKVGFKQENGFWKIDSVGAWRE
jgi:hypothetical protein